MSSTKKTPAHPGYNLPDTGAAAAAAEAAEAAAGTEAAEAVAVEAAAAVAAEAAEAVEAAGGGGGSPLADGAIDIASLPRQGLIRPNTSCFPAPRLCMRGLARA
jgi:hypothetical protein